MAYNISGIQQVGIGIANVHEAWQWYREHFGVNVPIFDEAAEANLMLPYTGGQPQQRHAILALSANGGGGFEIWQYTSRVPQLPAFTPQLGDLGIFAVKIKSYDVLATYEFLKSKQAQLKGYLKKTPDSRPAVFVEDPFENYFQIVESNNWFSKGKYTTGAVHGCIIGVSDIEKARTLYTEILGYDNVIYDETGVFEDFKKTPGGDATFRRVLLGHKTKRSGSFSKLLGTSEIELVQVLDRSPRKIFENRFWGDRGFIHLCFDISDMDDLRESCANRGFPFTVDSATAHKNGFDMGEAAGHFSYIEDPDGTLIEFVEAHKIPIIKKLNWYLNLKKRNPQKSLPHWMLKAITLNKVK